MPPVKQGTRRSACEAAEYFERNLDLTRVPTTLSGTSPSINRSSRRSYISYISS